MINLTITELAITILVIALCTGLMAYLVGYFIGNEVEKKKVIQFHENNQRTDTGELVETLYPLYPFTKNLRKP